VLVTGLKTNIAWRGSVAIDHYVIDDSSVLGPAVADAAAWYEAANWLGIVATPRTSHILKSDPAINGSFVDYDVPLSGGTHTSRLPAVNWVQSFVSELFLQRRQTAARDTNATAPFEEVVTIENCSCHLADLLSRFRIPRGTEMKYSNTTAFFHTFLETSYQKSKNAYSRLEKRKRS
jgi:hypothetical protein